MSLGSLDPLDDGYFGELRRTIDRFGPAVVSDHLSFGRIDGTFGHDLWPLPLNEESLLHFTRRVREAQDRLGRRIAIENVASYLRGAQDTLDEATFLAELAEAADCLLLVDVNNVVVSAHNHGFDAQTYLRRIPPHRVAYLHVAGHSQREGYRFDDHASVPNREVLDHLADALALFGDVPCIFEWDEGYPDLEGYLDEAERLSALANPADAERTYDGPVATPRGVHGNMSCREPQELSA